MVGPLDFGIVYMPWSVGTWFVDTPNILSLLSTLLITFYWQEILSVMVDRLSNKLINNLCKIDYRFQVVTNLAKFRIPFLLIAILVVILHVVATTNSFLHFVSGKIPSKSITHISDDAYTISAIVALIVAFGISLFFFIIGYRIFRVTDKRNIVTGDRKATRVNLP
jgi:uncharacterized membrane protein